MSAWSPERHERALKKQQRAHEALRAAAAKVKQSQQAWAKQDRNAQTRRDVILGRLLRDDPSPEAKRLRDGYIASLDHPTDVRLFADLTEHEIGESHSDDGTQGANQVGTPGRTPDAGNAELTSNRFEGELPQVAQGDAGMAEPPGPNAASPPVSLSLDGVPEARGRKIGGSAAMPAELRTSEIATGSPQKIELVDQHELQSQVGSVQSHRDDRATRGVGASQLDVDGENVALERLTTEAEPSKLTQKGGSSGEDNRDTPSPSSPFVPLVFDTPAATKAKVDGLKLGIRRAPLDDGSNRWGAFADTPEKARALAKIGLSVIKADAPEARGISPHLRP